MDLPEHLCEETVLKNILKKIFISIFKYADTGAAEQSKLFIYTYIDETDHHICQRLFRLM